MHSVGIYIDFETKQAKTQLNWFLKDESKLKDILESWMKFLSDGI